jgi:hypothetical protein
MGPVLALGLGLLAATLAADCTMLPVAPTSLQLSGTWDGTGADAQGAEVISWVLMQTGNTVRGTVSTRAVDPADGSCASCHKNKTGTFTGTIVGSSLTLTMFFPTGGDVPTPICSVTMIATADGVTGSKIASTYSGADTCEGPFTDGTFTMDHHS